MKNFSLIIGSLAGIFTTVAFVPQVVKILKTKHTKDLSLLTFSTFAAGVFLWLIYGISIREFPVIAANSLGFVLALTIVVMKIKHG